MKRLFLIFVLVAFSAIFLSACRIKNQAGYTSSEVKASWERSLQTLDRVLLLDGKAGHVKKMDADDLLKKTDDQGTDIYKKISDYKPLSLVEIINDLRLLLFEMSSSMDAYGAYSILRNSAMLPYESSLLTPPSEAVYLEGRLMIYRGRYLWIIDHNMSQLNLVKDITASIAKKTPNEEIKSNLVDALPRGGLIRRSQIYTKKGPFGWPHLSECAIGKYEPQSSIQVFVCDLKSSSSGLRAFYDHISYVENEMSLGKHEPQKKDFKRKNGVQNVLYFFYNASNYELHGIFHIDHFIIGIIGANSKDYSLAIVNEALDRLPKAQ